MSVRYHNVYDPPNCSSGEPRADPAGHRDALIAESVVCPDFVRREMRIDGHWLCPPVGMRAHEASHEWRTNFYADHDSKGRLPLKLGRRQDPDHRRRDAEFSRKVRSTQA